MSSFLSFANRTALGVLLLLLLFSKCSDSQSPIAVKKIVILGAQEDPKLSNLSRDGGASVLLNDRVVWLFDDTTLTAGSDQAVGFLSNSAAYSTNPSHNITQLADLDILTVDIQKVHNGQYPLHDNTVIDNGGWIPFQLDELRLNRQNPGKQRIAIWPGTNPIAVSPAEALLYAPIICIQNPSQSHQNNTYQGVTLVSIKASHAGPVAARLVGTIFTEGSIPYGGFAGLVGITNDTRVVYLFGVADAGLQVARVNLNAVQHISAYQYLEGSTFTSKPPSIASTQVYLSGSFAYGSVFYSPFFKTFLMVYFNAMADSTFYVRFLDLNRTVDPSAGQWIQGGLHGQGIAAEDVEAVVRYAWSDPQVLFASPTGSRGYNYAGFAHPEFWNCQYFQRWMFSYGVLDSRMQNSWLGEGVVAEKDAGGDGKHLMLSWTSQDEDADGIGKYNIGMAKLEFETLVMDSTQESPAVALKPGKFFLFMGILAGVVILLAILGPDEDEDKIDGISEIDCMNDYKIDLDEVRRRRESETASSRRPTRGRVGRRRNGERVD